MADNLPLLDTTTGTTVLIGTDEIAGVHYERNKLSIGADGVAVDASLTAPVPVAFGAQVVSDFREVPINCATAGDNVLLGAGVGQTIRVYAFFFMVAGAVTVKWKDGVAFEFHPGFGFLSGGASWAQDPMGRPWFTTTAGNALVLNLSAPVQVSGRLYYTQS